MSNDINMDDHDAIIRLEAGVEALRQTLDNTSQQQAERHGRMEGKIDRINGTVAQHEARLTLVEDRPVMPISQEEAGELVEQAREIWTVYSFGRWLVAAGVLALLGQAAALIILAINAAQGG